MELVVDGVTQTLARFPNKVENPNAINPFPDQLVIYPGENQPPGTQAFSASGVYNKIEGSDAAAEAHGRPDYKHETENWYLRYETDGAGFQFNRCALMRNDPGHVLLIYATPNRIWKGIV